MHPQPPPEAGPWGTARQPPRLPAPSSPSACASRAPRRPRRLPLAAGRSTPLRRGRSRARRGYRLRAWPRGGGARGGPRPMWGLRGRPCLGGRDGNRQRSPSSTQPAGAAVRAAPGRRSRAAGNRPGGGSGRPCASGRRDLPGQRPAPGTRARGLAGAHRPRAALGLGGDARAARPLVRSDHFTGNVAVPCALVVSPGLPGPRRLCPSPGEGGGANEWKTRAGCRAVSERSEPGRESWNSSP